LLHSPKAPSTVTLAGQSLRSFEHSSREQLLWTQGQYELLREELARRVRASRRVKDAGLDGEAALAAIPLQPRFFRFPYGRCKPEALALLRAHGLLGVEWDVAAEDDALTAEQAAAKALAKIRPGAIVLMHANGVPKHTDEIVRLLIPALRAKGYAFVTIAKLLSRGQIEAPLECYDETPGDTHQFDAIYGDGTRRIQ
jgi:peptidoglycan/xylan/chitin deacetylase (PgdA/CDA1 family)